jgi:hypothetical protein
MIEFETGACRQEWDAPDVVGCEMDVLGSM